MLLLRVVHVSSAFEFGAVLHDCLRGTLKAILHSHPVPEPHECYCLGLFMCPPLSSLELCFMIA